MRLWVAGFGNAATGRSSTVGGGALNIAEGQDSTIAGGARNFASNTGATVAGGTLNSAQGVYSFAAGVEAFADQDQCAVFGLWSTAATMSCLGQKNIFRIGGDHGFSVDYLSQRQDGGGNRWFYVGDVFAGNTISTWTGARLTDGGSWTNASDRDLKTDFTDVDALSVLARVAAMPIQQWRYKSETGQHHLGPVAQDFYAAFELGADDRHITTVDEGGVALVAIKGMCLVAQQKDAKIEFQQRTIRVLENQLQTQQRTIEAQQRQIDAARAESASFDARLAQVESFRDELARVRDAFLRVDDPDALATVGH